MRLQAPQMFRNRYVLFFTRSDRDELRFANAVITTRKTDQKPDEELLTKFKKNFTDVMVGGPATGGSRNHGTVNPAAVESAMQGRYVKLSSSWLL